MTAGAHGGLGAVRVGARGHKQGLQANTHTCIISSRCFSTTCSTWLRIQHDAVPTHLPLCSPTWDDQQHVDANYERAGLVADVNAAFGRNRRRDVLREKAEAAPEMLEAPIQDDELKAACAQVGRRRMPGGGLPWSRAHV